MVTSNGGARETAALEEIVRFQADIPKFTFDSKGNLVITLVVSPEHKWAALPLTDIRGRRFTFQAFAAPGRAARVKAKMAEAPVPGAKSGPGAKDG